MISTGLTGARTPVGPLLFYKLRATKTLLLQEQGSYNQHGPGGYPEGEGAYHTCVGIFLAHGLSFSLTCLCSLEQGDRSIVHHTGEARAQGSGTPKLSRRRPIRTHSRYETG